MFYKWLFLILINSALLLPVSAHDVWLIPGEGNTLMLVFGHPGELESYDPAKLVSAAAIDQQGVRHDLAYRVKDSQVVVNPKADTLLVSVNYDHGIWTEDSNEIAVNKPKYEVPGYRSSVHQKMFAKALLGWSPAANKPTGARLEIIPLENPFRIKPGDELSVQVMYEGAPLAGAELEMLGVFDLFLTNREGRISLPVPDQGFHYILAYHRIGLKDHPDTDTEKLSANLTFTIDID